MKYGLLVLLLCVGMSGSTGCKKKGDSSDSEGKTDPANSSISKLIDGEAESEENALSDLSDSANSAIKDVESKVSGEIEKAADSMVEHMKSLSMTLRSVKDKKTAETVSGKISELIGKIQASGTVLDQLDEETQVQALLPYKEKLESFAMAIQQEFQRLGGNPEVIVVLGEALQNLSDLPGFNTGEE